jgi:putative hydrolase of the HAD superfamily
MVIRTVLFDAVGTLFHVRGSVGAVYARVAARHGVRVDAGALQQAFAEAFAGMPPLCFPGLPVEDIADRERHWWKTVVASAFAGVPFEDFGAFFDDLFDHFGGAQAWELFPDALPTLRELRRRRLRLGIVSNFDSRLLPVCDGLQLASEVDTILMSTRVGFAKPDARIFQAALCELGAADGETLHVGDSRAEDFDGARAAGLHALLIDREGRETASSHCIANLQRILDVVPRT